MSNYSDLKTALQAVVNAANTAGDISDIQKYECLIRVDAYVDGREQLDALSKTKLDSYSIAGRSIHRRKVSEMRDEINRERNELMNILYGYVSFADFRTSEGVTDDDV